MFRTTIKGLLAHKLRLALSALAVVLGVSFMTGTFVLTDTIKHTFTGLFTQISAGKDAVIRTIAPYGNGNDSFTGEDRPLTPESLIPTVAATPGVAHAVGYAGGTVELIGRNGKPLNSQAPTLGLSWLPDPKLSVLSLRSGRAPNGPGEVTLDGATARKQGFGVGSQVTVVGNGGPARYTVVGITRFGTTDNLAGAAVIAFDLPTAEQVAGRPGYVTEIDVAAQPGINKTALLAAIGARLPKGYEVVPGSKVGAQQAAGIVSNINQFTTFLLVFAGVSLFVGAFIIFNTFSILVGQRVRELSLLRAIGASRRQINLSVLGEATATGLAGSAIGLGLGVLLAAGLYALLSAFGLSLPRASLVFAPRTAIVGLVVGTIVTVASAILPALRAGRVAPAAGLRDDAVSEETSLRRRAVSGGIVTGIGVLVLAAGLFASAGIALVGLGAAVTFVGVAMLAPFAVGPMVSLIGRPLPRLAGVTGVLGRENAARNPRRTASTASALMIGVTLVAAIATLAQSALVSFDSLFDRAISTNFVLSSSNFGPIPSAAEAALRAVPGVASVDPVRTLDWHHGKVSETLSGIDAQAGPGDFRLSMTYGSAQSLSDGDLLVDDTEARSQHYRVGQQIPMTFAASGTRNVTIGGIYRSNQLLGSYVMPNSVLSSLVNQVRDQLLLVDGQAGISGALQPALKSAAAPYNLKVDTVAQFKSDQRAQFAKVLGIVYALLGLSIIIALIGVVNTLALSVMERTREIGLLRAVGTQRRQLKRMIRAESLLVSLIGAFIGLVLGLGLGAAVVSSLASTFVTQLAVPVGTVIVVLVAAAFFGVLAAVWPARRAAKMDVLQAIYTV